MPRNTFWKKTLIETFINLFFPIINCTVSYKIKHLIESTDKQATIMGHNDFKTCYKNTQLI